MREANRQRRFVGRLPSAGAGATCGRDAASGDAAYNRNARSADVGRLPSAGADATCGRDAA